MTLSITEEIRREIKKCVRCGACRAVCPTFAVEQREGAAARGKIGLAEARFSGDIGTSVRFREDIEQCLLCLACVAACPNGVRTDDIVLRARSFAVEDKGEGLFKKLVLRRLLPSGTLMSHAVKMAFVLQGAVMEGVPEDRGLRLRFPLPGIDRERIVPKLAPKFLLDDYRDERGSDADTGREKVGFFVGCMINYIYTDIGRKTIELVRRAGARAVLPPGQVCCGLPAMGVGDREGAKTLALKNLEAFEGAGVDTIVTACASCGSTLKEYYPKLFAGEDPALVLRAQDQSGKVRDISEFLVDRGSMPGRRKFRVTYHDPCHLRRGMGVTEAPRLLLNAALDSNFVEMSHPCRCCGFGGSFNLTYYDFSLKVLERKISSILDTGAETLVTGCPGCMMNIQDGLSRAGSSVTVKHLVDVLV